MDQRAYISNLLHILSDKHHKTIEALSSMLDIEYDDRSALVHDYEEFDKYLERETRVQTGAYYTPRPLAEAMVKMSLKDYCVLNMDMDHKLGDQIFHDGEKPLQGQDFINRLKSIQIADISCGSGMFLRVAYDVLVELYVRYDCYEGPDHVIGNLYGYDVNKDSLDVLKIWFADKFLERDCKIGTFNLYHGDTLLHDPGMKFDLIIGNPPYVGEKGNKALFAKYKHLPGYEGRMDLFYFFIYQGIHWLKPKGLLNFITTNYWVTADGAQKLRAFVKNLGIYRLINLDECKLFEDAKGMHNLIFSLSPSSVDQTLVRVIPEGQTFSELKLWEPDYQIDPMQLFSESQNILLYESKDYFVILDKMIQASPFRMEAYARINQGIVSGGDRVTDAMMERKFTAEHLRLYDLHKGEGIFVVDFDDETCCKPFYKNSHIGFYSVKQKPEKNILYITDQTEISERLKGHLMRFKPMLEQRREVVNGVRKWYALQWYRDQTIFEGEKIVAPQRAYLNKFAYHEGPFYASADIYYITHGPLKMLLGLLNSKLIHFWLYTRGKRKGQYLELYAKPLSLIPVPTFDANDEKALVEKVESILTHGFDEKLQGEIDQIIYRSFNLTDEEIRIVERLYKNRSKYA